MDVFNQGTPPSPTIDVNTLVGEGKKYGSADELAKAYVNAENFIDVLKQEKAAVEADREATKTRLEVLERLAATKINNDPTPNPNDPGKIEPKVTKEPEINLEEKIRSTLEAERERERKTANRNMVNTKLIEAYGEKAREVIRVKADELGVSLDWLTSIAETSPAAFFKTLGFEEKSNTGTPGVKTDINPAAMPVKNSAKPDTYAFYREMRKTDPARYYSAETQRAMFNAAKTNAKFYEE